MNQTKLKYARIRLQTIADIAIRSLTRESVEKVDLIEVIKRLQSGELTFKPKDVKLIKNHRYDSECDTLHNFFLSLVKKENSLIDKKNKKERKEYDKKKSQIQQDLINVEDNLILGEEQEAMQLLASFTEKYN